MYFLNQRNFHKYFTLYFIVFGIVLSTFGALVSYKFQIDEIHKSVDKKAVEVFDIKTKVVLKPAIKHMDNIVKSLGLNTTIQDFLKTKNSHSLEELEQIFLAIAYSQNNIMQARLIGRDGKEIIRVDRTAENSDPFIVDKSKLQDKCNRDYFQILSKMKTQNIWHSKLDLNIENGKIEIPYKPTIRIGMPLFDKETFIGVVIVNLLTNELFDSIGTSSGFNHYIIDKDKNYILHPNSKFSFNKYKNIDKSFAEDFPDGLNGYGIYAYPIGNILQNDDNATFILKEKDNYKSSLIAEKIRTGIIVLILTIFMSFVIAIYISKKPKQLQEALVKAHSKLHEFAAIIDKYIITATTKPDSTITEVSSAFVESSGYAKDELIGKQMNIINCPEQDKSIFVDLWNTILIGKTWHGIMQNQKKDGTNYWLEQHIVPKMTADNKIESFVSVGVDISAKVELEKLASIDKLTGIYNRRMIEEFMINEIESHKRHSQKMSVIMVDIDHFKSVNDTYGHQVGDMVLSQTTKIISKNLRKSDIFGRYGGEEFIIICPQTSKEDAFVLAEKLRVAMENNNFETVGKKTICLGISELADNDDFSSIVERADKALYRAKNEGRNKTISS